MRKRYIPPDIKEDVKLGKIIPMKALIPTGIVFLAGLFLDFTIVKSMLLQMIILLIPTGITLLVYVFNLPHFIWSRIHFERQRKQVSTLADVCAFDDIAEECRYADGTRKHFYEYSVGPWEIMPEGDRETVANRFAEDMGNLLKDDVAISIYGTCMPEGTSVLEQRYQRLSSLPPALRTLEQARITTHFNSSRQAAAVRYIVALTGKDEGLCHAPYVTNMGRDLEPLGSDYVRHLIETQLIPVTGLKRGITAAPEKAVSWCQQLFKKR